MTLIQKQGAMCAFIMMTTMAVGVVTAKPSHNVQPKEVSRVIQHQEIPNRMPMYLEPSWVRDCK